MKIMIRVYEGYYHTDFMYYGEPCEIARKIKHDDLDSYGHSLSILYNEEWLTFNSIGFVGSYIRALKDYDEFLHDLYEETRLLNDLERLESLTCEGQQFYNCCNARYEFYNH